MRRTFVLGAVGATALSLGLGIGATLAAADPPPPTPTDPITMMDGAGGAHMLDAEHMTSMANGSDMTDIMGTNGMDAMHSEVRAALQGTVSDEVLAACDAAHTSMSDSSTPMPTDVGANHDAHHPGGQQP